ncbi:MAG: hypothetical protein H6Q20_858 [Bacteroidetes bacterium]|jgi:hypothetical protein|nr:hypothetical protein [Bacteroidota bacterium]
MKISNFINKVITLILVFCFVNCARENKISDVYLSNIANPEYSGVIVVQLPKQKTAVVPNRKLYSLYREYYVNRYSYKEFIKSLIYGEISDIVNYAKLSESTDENFDKIHNEYRRYGLLYIVNKYLEKDINSDNLILQPSLGFIAVIKIMFENNYYIYFDDYRGEYIFRKEMDKETQLIDVFDNPDL